MPFYLRPSIRLKYKQLNAVMWVNTFFAKVQISQWEKNPVLIANNFTDHSFELVTFPKAFNNWINSQPANMPFN